MNNINDLLPDHDGESESSDHLCPSNLAEKVEHGNDRTREDLGERLEFKDAGKVLHNDRSVDGGSLVIVEIGADEEDFVEETESKQDILP